LPKDIRRSYIAHFKTILPPASNVFLLTVGDAEKGETQEVRLGISAEIAALYGEDFEIELAHDESVTEGDRDETGDARCAEHKVYRLAPG
jgi:thiopurine S-methyltransferase